MKSNDIMGWKAFTAITVGIAILAPLCATYAIISTCEEKNPMRDPFIIAHPGSNWYPPEDNVGAMCGTYAVIRDQLDIPIADRCVRGWRPTLYSYRNPYETPLPWQLALVCN